MKSRCTSQRGLCSAVFTSFLFRPSLSESAQRALFEYRCELRGGASKPDSKLQV
jgi:hypothetical protein